MIGLVISVVVKTTSYFDQHSGRKQNCLKFMEKTRVEDSTSTHRSTLFWI